MNVDFCDNCHCSWWCGDSLFDSISLLILFQPKNLHFLDMFNIWKTHTHIFIIIKFIKLNHCLNSWLCLLIFIDFILVKDPFLFFLFRVGVTPYGITLYSAKSFQTSSQVSSESFGIADSLTMVPYFLWHNHTLFVLLQTHFYPKHHR